MKPILYIDMDNVLVDFPSGIEQLDEKTKQEYQGNYDEVLGIFSKMKPLDGDNRASYCILEFNNKEFNFKLKRVKYSYNETIKNLNELKVPFRESFNRCFEYGKII